MNFFHTSKMAVCAIYITAGLATLSQAAYAADQAATTPAGAAATAAASSSSPTPSSLGFCKGSNAPIGWASSATRTILTFEPTVFSLKNGTSLLGLNYTLNCKLYSGEPNPLPTAKWDEKRGSYVWNYSYYDVDLKGTGSLVTDAALNPNNLVNLELDGDYNQLDVSGKDGYIFIASGFAKFEADQAFKNKDTILGAKVGVWTPIGIDNILYLGTSLGQVSPGADLTRATALGTTTNALKNYYRADSVVEFTHSTKIIPYVSAIHLLYWSFNEISAPAAIRSAHLANFGVSEVRLNFPGKLFLAYSSGKLPFDQKTNSTFKIGFSYQLPTL